MRTFLIVNVGSTSIKTRLFDADLQVLAHLAVDIGNKTIVLIDGENLCGELIHEQYAEIMAVEKALDLLLTYWQDWLKSAHVTLTAIAHRVVHGADWFNTLTPITSEVMQRLAELDPYAPLHNPLNRLGIQQALIRFPRIAQFALFDTAFHCHLPTLAKRYAIPEELSKTVAFYRYGFHGLSCQHSLTTSAQWLDCEPTKLNLIVLHLGGGASATAIRAGVSVDTSMGFSPTEGLMMASRCGDIDPMILLTLLQQGMDSAELSEILNHQSGLQAICGDTDMRCILQRAVEGDSKAKLAIDMFCYRIKKAIGAYCAILGNVDALVFTGGIGEHAAEIRKQVLMGLESLGFVINDTANQLLSVSGDISGKASHSKIFVIHAEEERVCAQAILTYLDNQ